MSGLHVGDSHDTITETMPPSTGKKRDAAEAVDSDAVSLRRWNRGLFAGLLVCTFVSLVFPLFDTDFWWHLKTGEMILESGQVPQKDWFTFTDNDKPWIDLHWGFQVLITLLYRLGGSDLVVLTKAATITAAVGIAWQASGRALPAWLKAPLWFLPVVAISGRGYERPEMLSQLYLATWLFVAFQAHMRPKLVWLLPVVQLVWVNSHALFVLGLVVGALFVVDWLARNMAQGRFRLEPAPAAPDARTLIRVGGLVALACFASPYFEEGALFPLTLYRKFNVEQAFYSVNIGEFQQPIQYVRRYGFRNIYLLAEIGVWLLTCASFVWVMLRHRRWSLLRLGLFAAFSHLAWEMTRNTNIFSLVSGAVMCANIGDALPAGGRGLAPRAQWWLNRSVAAGLACFVALVVSGQWNVWSEGTKPFALGESEDWFIHNAAKFAGQPGFPDRAFVANNGQAAVYLYHNGPERLVFMDGRLEVCTMQTFQIFNQILRAMAVGDPSWQKVFDLAEKDLPVVILDSRGSRSAINGMLNTPGWRLVFADRSAAVFLDNVLAEKLNLPRVDPEPLKYPPGTKPRAAPPPPAG